MALLRGSGILFASFVALATILPRNAHACDPAVIGHPIVDGLGVLDGNAPPSIPRNYAYVRAADARVPIRASPITLFRDADALTPGPHELMFGAKTVVDDVVDETRPVTPPLASGELVVGDGPCSEEPQRKLTLRLGADATDDRTPSERVTYAVFAGGTKADAEATTDVAAFRLASPVRELALDDAPKARWFAVAAIDLAGNVGPRSPAIELEERDETGGCSAAPASLPRSDTALLAGMTACALVVIGRRARRKA